MRLTIPLLMLLILAALPLAHASSTLSITSSALPVAFVGEAYTFVATSSAPVSSWSIAPIGSGLSVSYTAGSSQAVVSGTLSAGTQTFNLTAIGMSGGTYTQEWNVTTYSSPFVWSVPAFQVVSGQQYSYTPSATSTGTWNFSGAPYLQVNSATGVLSGVATSGTYTDSLSLTTAQGTYTQVWVTTTGGYSGSAGFTCNGASVNLSLSSGYAAGCSPHGVFSGEELIYNGTLSAFSNTNGFSLTPSGNAYLYVYGAPGTVASFAVNGTTHTGTEPSSGFLTLHVSPGIAQVSPPPPGGGSSNVLVGAPSFFSTYEIYIVGAVMLGALAGLGYYLYRESDD